MKITAHTIIKNEENYLWFALTSAIEHVDEVLIWDTGSTDSTLKIVEEIKSKYPKKIKFRNVGSVDPDRFTLIRQEMLDQTDCDWLMILDGDDVWWDDEIRKTVDFLKVNKDRYDTMVHSYQNPIGDIYHYQHISAHKYKIDDKVGNVGIRFINRNIDGLNVSKPHGQQGFYDKNGVLVQELNPKRRYHVGGISYLHFTNLPRSNNEASSKVPKRKMKYKHDLGLEFPKDFYYPECFFKEKPSFIPSPWQTMSNSYKIRAMIETPLKKIKRKLITSKVGY